MRQLHWMILTEGMKWHAYIMQCSKAKIIGREGGPPGDVLAAFCM